MRDFIFSRGRSRQRTRGSRGDWQTTTALWGNFGVGLTSLGVGAQVNQLVAYITPAAPATGGVVVPGVLRLHELEVAMHIVPSGNNPNIGYYAFGFGVYKTMFDRSAGTWTSQGMFNPSDAMRDDWLHLEAQDYQFGATTTVPFRVSFNFRKKLNLVIGEGEGLQIGLCSGGANASAVAYQQWIRFRVSQEY